MDPNLFLFRFLLIASCLFSKQAYVTISGKVTNLKGEAVAYANVYIDQTSIGATTDLNGKYYLTQIPLGQKRLIVSQVNYEKVIFLMNFKVPEEIVKNIILKDAINVSDQVIVEVERDDKFVQLFNRFKPQFLGFSEFAKECEIVNREYLELKENDYGGYEGKSLKPIHIKNYALGYDIFYTIDSVENIGRTFALQGDMQFKELVPRDNDELEKWLRNRKTAFRFSLRYFLKSLYHNKTSEAQLYYEGMDAFPNAESYPSYKLNYKDIVSDAKNNFKRLNLNNSIMEVVMIRPVPLDYRRHFRRTVVFDENKLISFLKVNGHIEFNENGYFIPSGGFKAYEVEGYFTFYRVAGMLPDDYDPDSSSMSKSD